MNNMKDEDNTINQNPFCNHDFCIVLLSNPPKYKCGKCGFIKDSMNVLNKQFSGYMTKNPKHKPYPEMPSEKWDKKDNDYGY